jgi:hypothetical protein
VCLADDAGDPLPTLDPVLERDHRSIRSEQRSAGGGRGLGVGKLDGKDHGIDRADLGRVVGDPGHGDGETVVFAGEGKTVVPQGLEVGAARHQCDLGGPVAQQMGGEESADPAGGHDGDAHDATPGKPDGLSA